MFAGIYRDFAGKLECRDFKFTRIACIPAIPVIFEVNKKKLRTFYIYISLTGYSPTSGTWIFPWFFWNQIFYRSFVGVRLPKLIHPTWHPWVHSVGFETNLKGRNLQIWPTLRASIALFRIDYANKNESIGWVIDSVSHVKLKQFLPGSRSLDTRTWIRAHF